MDYNVDFQKTIEDAFLLYGASVAQERAIPDVRDCLKIGLRQGIYAQFSNGLMFKDKFQKAQKSVAAAMAQSYIHGDVSMYDTFIRAAKPWVYRYPIETVQGAYGDPCAPDNHSASRYVEMKAGALADYLVDGLKKDAVAEWYDNYDDTEKIPNVFPSIGYWNIVNGCSGIAVTMITSVPEFNLKEVNSALIKIIRNPNIDFDSIYCPPDFAQGGTIVNGNDVKASLCKGTGAAIRMRAVLKYVPSENMIQATEMPHGVFTNTVIGQLKTLTDKDENYGIIKVVDHTKKTADIRIYLKTGVAVDKMIAKLYKDTDLENTFPINMVMLDKGRFPKVFGWRAACDAYVAHCREGLTRILTYELNKLTARDEILTGLIAASAHIDDIVKLIRSATDQEAAEKLLIAKYSFSEAQTKAILAIKLSSLTKIDGVKLSDEKVEVGKDIAKHQHLLDTPKDFDEELVKKFLEVAERFGDDRRTTIKNSLTEVETNATPVKEASKVGLLLFDNNMMRMVNMDSMEDGKRGRKGTSLKPPRGASIKDTLYTTSQSTISIVTDKGRLYSFSLSELDEDIDYSIYQFVALQANDEKAVTIFDSDALTQYSHLIFITRKGLIKKTEVSEYSQHTKKGLVAIKLDDDDYVIQAYRTASPDDKYMIASNKGNYVFYSHTEVPVTGRVSKGVKAIKLEDNDFVASATQFINTVNYDSVLTVSTNGRGKCSPVSEYKETSRAVKGNQAMKMNNGEELAIIYLVPATQDKLALLAGKRIVTLDKSSIPMSGRTTKGVTLIDNKNSTDQIIIL